MAVWTPGSYLIREYERHVEAVTAADPSRAPLAVEKTRKNRWRVTTNGARTVWVRYRVYAHEMSVRTNWVDEELAMINGAPTFITLLESPSRRAHEVRLVLPRTWARSFSGMTPGAGENTYVAADYDTLVDSPIVAGSPSVYEFSVRGKPHYLVNFRERGVWNGPQAARDLAKVAEADRAVLGRRAVRPVLLLQRHRIGGERARAQELDAHEHPARRDQVARGISRMAQPREPRIFPRVERQAAAARRAGAVRLRERGLHAERSGSSKGSPITTPICSSCGQASPPARSTSPRCRCRSARCRPPREGWSSRLKSASYDAWIKYYRTDENTPNTAISYYVKGAVIGFLLDAHIRRRRTARSRWTT